MESESLKILLKQYDHAFASLKGERNGFWTRFIHYFTLETFLTVITGSFSIFIFELDIKFRLMIGILILTFGSLLSFIWFQTIRKGGLNIHHFAEMIREIERKFPEESYRFFTEGDKKLKKTMKESRFNFRIMDLALIVPVIFLIPWIILFFFLLFSSSFALNL